MSTGDQKLIHQFRAHTAPIESAPLARPIVFPLINAATQSAWHGCIGEQRQTQTIDDLPIAQHTATFFFARALYDFGMPLIRSLFTSIHIFSPSNLNELSIEFLQAGSRPLTSTHMAN
jgi:hypothetical protein